MKKYIFTDVVELAGESCKPFEGDKLYVSTGSLDVDKLNNSSIEIVNYEERPSRANLIVKNGDVIFAKMQGTKKTLFIDKNRSNHIYSTGFCAVSPKTELITQKCLYYLLTSDAFLKQKDKYCSGATQKAISNENLKKIEIKVPYIDYQSRITRKLDLIISIIKKRKKEIEELDNLIKSQFIELFEEKGYNEVPINSILETSFWLMPATPKYLIDGEIPYITSKNIKNRKINFDDVKLISKKDYYRISYNRPIMKGDILISMIGTLGQIAIVGDNRKFYGQNIYLLRLNKKIIDETYFCEFFDSDKIQHKLQEKSHKSTQAYLKANHVEDLTIILPPISNQKSFKKFVQKVDKSKFFNKSFIKCN
ncbi:MAG: restriction endonuclease subunit S [Erysipelotrichaceae bacterium]|nr:restriction endonuclease subunit S [Tissierellia bacterium]